MNTKIQYFFCTLLLSALTHFSYAQCDSNAGTMDANQLTLCDGDVANATHGNDQFLEPNDVMQFVLHDSPNDELGTVFATSATPNFQFTMGIIYEETYYISAIVGNDDGGGNVDLTDMCLSVASGTPVVFAPPILFNCSTQNLSCDGTIDGTIVCNPEDYIFIWSNGQTGPVINNLPSGVFEVTVTDVVYGCTAVAAFTIGQPIPPICFVTVNGDLGCTIDQVTATVTCTGGTAPYTYTWSNGDIVPITILTNPGVYSVTLTDANGCTAVASAEILLNPEDCGVIEGQLIIDENINCQNDPGEVGLENWLVQALGATNLYGWTDENGAYEIGVFPGDYVVQVSPPNNYWEVCTPTVNVNVPDLNSSATANYEVKKLIDCPYLTVDISTFFIRRCFSGNYYVNYCNNGTTTAEAAYVDVVFDELISILDASINYIDLGNDTYRFELGDIAINQCGSFNISVNFSCDALLGQTLCAEAHIYPDDNCDPADPLWSGASIQVSSECTPDSIIFTIENVGTGNMDATSSYIVVEDGVMLMAEPYQFQLESMTSTKFSVEANGATYVMLADQVAYHPGNSAPTLAVEGCGTNGMGAFSTGFVTQFPENDADPFISIECREVIGAWDPNDKQGFPKGYGDDHLIEVGQELEYFIRFQNTGTDTAFNIVVEDVLSPHLDITTLRPGVSSHPYVLDILGGDTLHFIFDNILLPDSNINEPLSHGFIKFRIAQMPNLPLGTVIENDAGIYFDFNEPVITNTVTHTLGEHFIEVKTTEVFLPGVDISAFPNPFSQVTTLQIKGLDLPNTSLLLFDVTGRMVHSEKFENNELQLHKGKLEKGLYFFHIVADGVKVGSGKLVLE